MQRGMDAAARPTQGAGTDVLREVSTAFRSAAQCQTVLEKGETDGCGSAPSCEHP